MGQYARLYPDTHNHARGSTIRACPLCPNWNARGWSACRSAFRKRIQNRLQHHTVQTAKSGHIISLYTNNILCTFQLTLLTIKQPYKSSETIWVEFLMYYPKKQPTFTWEWAAGRNPRSVYIGDLWVFPCFLSRCSAQFHQPELGINHKILRCPRTAANVSRFLPTTPRHKTHSEKTISKVKNCVHASLDQRNVCVNGV